MDENSRSGFISQRHGSADPDLYQNVTDPQHYCLRDLTQQDGSLRMLRIPGATECAHCAMHTNAPMRDTEWNLMKPAYQVGDQ